MKSNSSEWSGDTETIGLCCISLLWCHGLLVTRLLHYSGLGHVICAWPTVSVIVGRGLPSFSPTGTFFSFLLTQSFSLHLPWWLSGKESTCRKRCRFDPWVRKIPWRWKWSPTPVFLPGESHGQRSLAGYSPRGRKESDTTERLHFTSLSNSMTITALLGWWQEPCDSVHPP